MATLRRIPWLEATALVLCDVAWHDGKPLAPSPRQVLKRQVERAAELGFTPMFGSELEFYLLKESYEEAHAKHYRDLTPSVPYILDYHILATTYDEPLLRQIRNGMQGAGIKVETSKGEAWPGQQEINFRYADAVTMADNHTVYKNGAKEIAYLNGCSITFMAKPDHTWIGNSCHIHSSLWRDGESAFAGESDVVQAVPRRPDRLPEGAGDLPRADDQLVQALRGRELGADDARVGRTTTARAASGSSATARPSAPRRGSPAGTPTRTSPSPPSSRPACTGSRTSSSCRRRSRATRTSPTPSASRTRCGRGSPRSRRGRWRAPRSATTSSTTT